jgi:hypothetical protein
MKAFRLTLLAALLATPALANAATMQCTPFQSFSTTFPSGTGYTADADGVVVSVNTNDVLPLEQSGCTQIGTSGYTMIGRIVGANMNITTDQSATMFLNPGQYYVPTNMIVKDCSASLTTAAGQVYDAASKGGNVLFGSAVTQVFSSCTGAGTAESITGKIATGGGAGAVVDASTVPPILSLTTAQGAAATANVYFYGYVLGK